MYPMKKRPALMGKGQLTAVPGKQRARQTYHEYCWQLVNRQVDVASCKSLQRWELRTRAKAVHRMGELQIIIQLQSCVREVCCTNIKCSTPAELSILA